MEQGTYKQPAIKQLIEKLQAEGSDEIAIALHLAEYYLELSANAIQVANKKYMEQGAKSEKVTRPTRPTDPTIEVVEKLRAEGKDEATIVRYLAKHNPELSANAIQKRVKLGRNKVLTLVSAARNGRVI